MDINMKERFYYERRSKQYYLNNAVEQKNIVTLTAQIKSFLAMFLDEPHSHPRYYGELLKTNEQRLFAPSHEPAPYYTSGVALLLVEKYINNHNRELRQYKYHAIMLLRIQIGGQNMPDINDNRISDYALKIADVLRIPERCNEECTKAMNTIRNLLHNFKSDNSSPPHRLRAFTKHLIQSIYPAILPNVNIKEKEPKSGASETGQILWYDDWKNFGFIKRDIGGTFFVHGGEIDKIPWHLRNPGVRVTYTVGPNPKKPNLMMAKEVSIADI